MNIRKLPDINKIVIKVGTSTLTYENGELNLRRIEELARVIADIKNSGKDVILVTSGAIGAGVGRLGLGARPTVVKQKQATAAVGQCQLMCIYDEFFRRYNKTAGQILLTKDVVTNEKMHENAINTFDALLSYGVIPIVNENDAVSTHEILFGDNDTLSAHVASITKADLLIILTDVDGLYDENKITIHEISEITDNIRNLVGGAGSKQGVGGMVTKLMAVEIAAEAGAKTIIMNGKQPSLIYNILEGEEIGTFFNF